MATSRGKPPNARRATVSGQRRRLRIQLRDGAQFLEFMAKTLENLEQQVTSAQP